MGYPYPSLVVLLYVFFWGVAILQRLWEERGGVKYFDFLTRTDSQAVQALQRVSWAGEVPSFFAWGWVSPLGDEACLSHLFVCIEGVEEFSLCSSWF